MGGGITPVLAAVKLAVLESLLPSLTFQNGPPSCTIQQINILRTSKFRNDIFIKYVWKITLQTNIIYMLMIESLDLINFFAINFM